MYSGQQNTKKKAKEPSFGSCRNNKENKKGKADAPQSLCECCHSHQNHQKEKNEVKVLSCEGCLKYKKHQQKKEEARQGYKSDKSVSEGKSNNDTIFFSLDLQKVRMLPEIPGVKSAVFTGRICAYNESFSPIGRQ